MAETDITRLPSTVPGQATAEQGQVLLEGPRGAIVTMTPEAAEATGDNLRRAARAAQKQSRSGPRAEGAVVTPIRGHDPD